MQDPIFILFDNRRADVNYIVSEFMKYFKKFNIQNSDERRSTDWQHWVKVRRTPEQRLAPSQTLSRTTPTELDLPNVFVFDEFENNFDVSFLT